VLRALADAKDLAEQGADRRLTNRLKAAARLTRWSPVPALPTASVLAFEETGRMPQTLPGESTLLVFDFDRTLAATHMFWKLRTEGWKLREHDRASFYIDVVFGGEERLARLAGMLRAARERGARVVVLSNGIGHEIEEALREARLDELVDQVMGGEVMESAGCGDKPSAIARLCLHAAEGGRAVTHVVFADDDRDNYPGAHDGAVGVGDSWALNYSWLLPPEECAALPPLPAVRMVAWPVGEGEGDEGGLRAADLDRLAALLVPPPTGERPRPPRIPQRALQLAYDPSAAWQVIKVAQQPRALPLERFTRPPPQPEGTVRFVVVSDTHNAEARHGLTAAVPEGDVLLHCGDFTQTGCLKEVRSFVAWFGALPHPRKVVIAGNHDLSLDEASYPRLAPRFGHAGSRAELVAAATEARALIEAIPGCEYLCDSGTQVRGVRVWGSPWQPEFHDWAFNLPRGKTCRDKWQLIPAHTDVVLTHGPPLGYGDQCASGQRAGCIDLLDELQQRVRPQVLCFGHIHEAYGAYTDGSTTYLNASTCNLRYRADNGPLVFDLPVRE